MSKNTHEFTNAELTGALKKHEKTAEELLNDQSKMAAFLTKVKAWLNKARKVPVIGALVDEIVTMVELAADYVKGNYRAIPFRTMISIVAALAYALSPVDLIPDVVPIAGYIDDAAVITLILQLGVSGELRKYRKWKRGLLDAKVSKVQDQMREGYVNKINKRVLAGAFLSDNQQIKLLVADDFEDEIPVVCSVLVEEIPKQHLQDLGFATNEAIVGFYSKVFDSEEFTWSILGKRLFMLEYDCKTFDDDYIIVEDE